VCVDVLMHSDEPTEHLLSHYRSALAAYRRPVADVRSAAVATIVESAVILVDPAGVLWCGVDGGYVAAYDAMNARIWGRLCAVLDAGDDLSEPLVVTVVTSAFDHEFGTVTDWVSDEFTELMSTAFEIALHPTARLQLRTLASLIWNRLARVDFLPN